MDYDFEIDGRGLITRIIYRLQDPSLTPVTDLALARSLGFCPRQLQRTFFSVMGEGLGQYAHRLRMEYAAGLLSLSEEPVKAIAAELHYNSQSNLTRAFVGHFGVSPTEFRDLNPGEAHVFPGFYALTGTPIDIWPTEVGFRTDWTFVTTIFYNCGIFLGQLP